MLNKNLLISIKKNIYTTEGDDKTIILNLKTGHYFGINNVGSFFWKQFKKRKTVEEIISKTKKEYEIDDENLIMEDLERFLNDMLLKGLVKLK
ncbi:coenzyme PQQ synthesis protein D (PqqD) [Scopulibacillus darangshiensis]|uniref:Coenzyme PQQ synthesis protein D (PqqD) n=1 Tax=Scopulibacillus darangshiensis TaxID=442528 RepID=A0A4R2P593_9BACL|nr:PqqD family protein [Scopulibacillus darangshiensis]TCP30009.1 coenzyme PQQ synthesis protein D (PqqD) [Scopulibacillus darangshiensis]